MCAGQDTVLEVPPVCGRLLHDHGALLDLILQSTPAEGANTSYDAQVKTRFWNFQQPSGGFSVTMVPLLELANHADPGNANAHVDRLPDGSWVFLNATANISAGEEARSSEVLADNGHVSWQQKLAHDRVPRFLSCTSVLHRNTSLRTTHLENSAEQARQCAWS